MFDLNDGRYTGPAVRDASVKHAGIAAVDKYTVKSNNSAYSIFKGDESGSLLLENRLVKVFRVF